MINGDSGSFEMAQAKNTRFMLPAHIGERLSSQESTKNPDRENFWDVDRGAAEAVVWR